jgi:hypothetical protein
MLRVDRLLLTALTMTLCFTGACSADAPAERDDDAEEEPTEVADDELRSAVSCRERADMAYEAGTPHAITVIHVGGKPVSKPTGHAFLKMQAAAHADGIRLSLTSGFRTMTEQRRLYNCYVTRSCNNGNLAARPGYSHHQNGLALDLSTSSWLTRNAARFGFVRTVRKEPWHYEFLGEDPGGPCTRGDASPQPDALPWVSPIRDGTYGSRLLPLKVRPTDPRIVRVAYYAGNFFIGASTDKAHDFVRVHSFGILGERTFTALGYDVNGVTVVESTVDVTLQ